jgi:bifunctional glutamyl/prolyl-tRNA synthetase
MFRRGLQLEALKEFILAQGASKNVTLQEWDKFWTTNKKVTASHNMLMLEDGTKQNLFYIVAVACCMF